MAIKTRKEIGKKHASLLIYTYSKAFCVTDANMREKKIGESKKESQGDNHLPGKMDCDHLIILIPATQHSLSKATGQVQVFSYPSLALTTKSGSGWG